MLKIKTTAEIIFTVLAEHITDRDVACAVLEAEMAFNNNPGMLKIGDTQIGVRVYISGAVPKYYREGMQIEGDL